MKTLKLILLGSIALMLTLLYSSCEKEEGTGGRSSISGRIYNTDYSPNFAGIVDEYYMPETDVYIIYGDDETYSDRIKSNYDGYFRFEYLREGNYTIYAYSTDSTGQSTSSKIPASIDVSLGKKENKDVGTIQVIDELDYDDGSSSISGKVYKINYNATYTSINEEYYSPDEDVFIVYGDELTYFEKTKTRWDGSYSFTNLIKGPYKVFAFSEDPSQTTASNLIEIHRDTIIESNHQDIILPDLVIAD